MHAERPVRALVLGAVTRDDLVGATGDVPGGVVFHAGLALARLGAQVRVVTRVRKEDAAQLLGPLETEGVEILALPSRETTRYHLDYGGPIDRHELLATSDPIALEDVPAAWRASDVVQLGPLHRRDLAPGMARGLSGLIGLDVQGLLRLPTARGTRLAASSELATHLDGVHVVKASEEELPLLLAGSDAPSFVRRLGLSELIATRGHQGVHVVTAQDEQEIKIERAAGNHTVGAGDVFLAAYLLLRVRGAAPDRAARGACHVAARKIACGTVPRDAGLLQGEA